MERSTVAAPVSEAGDGGGSASGGNHLQIDTHAIIERFTDSLYSDFKVFGREMVANGVDAYRWAIHGFEAAAEQNSLTLGRGMEPEPDTLSGADATDMVGAEHYVPAHVQDAVAEAKEQEDTLRPNQPLAAQRGPSVEQQVHKWGVQPRVDLKLKSATALSFEDYGCGMTEAVLKNNYWAIAKSTKG